MELHGKIRNFASYTAEQLEQMRKDLSIAMPIGFLQHCAKYYKTQAKRDPAIDELKMLDRLAVAVQLSPASCAPVELHTNDAFVANTYADMMEKRHVLKPDSRVPMSFGEAIGLANAYLGRAGRRNELPATPILSESIGGSTFSIGKNCVGSTSGVQLRLLSSCPIPNRSDDLLAVLLPSTGAGSSQRSAQLSLNQLLNDPAFSSLVKRVSPISHGGLLSALLSEASGAWIDLRRLSQSEEPLPLSALVDSFEDAYFIRIPRENEEKVFHMAKDKGVRALIFATLTAKSTVVFHRSQKESFSIDTAFLRSVCTLHSVKLRLQNEAEGALTKADCKPLLPQTCAYLMQEEKEILSPVACVGGLSCTSASKKLKEAFYLNAFYTALLPVVHQSLAGSPYPEQKLSITLQTPRVGQATEACASAILGLYRLQAELGIASSTPLLFADSEEEDPVLTVFSVAKGQRYPSLLSKEENRVYLLKAQTETSRLPDFDSLRKLLDRLCSMQRNGIIASAYVLCGESPVQGLKQMEHDGIYCRLVDGKHLTSPETELAVLVETPYELADTELIGLVAKHEEEISEETVAPILAPAHSLIWSDVPEIVLVAAPNDANARMLAAVLNQKGANARLFFTAEGSELPLSRALLTSQTLILCADAELPRTPQVSFAYQTMLHAGGRVLYVGTRAARVASELSFPKGFSAENLEALCKKNEILEIK